MSSRAEAADVVAVVDVARRRADEHELREALRLLDRREHADHRAHRVADEDHVAQLQLAADLEHVVGVALQRVVLAAVVGGEVGAAGADVVEEDDAVVVLERRRDEAPHVLVAAEAVGEDHRPGPLAGPDSLTLFLVITSTRWDRSACRSRFPAKDNTSLDPAQEVPR